MSSLDVMQQLEEGRVDVDRVLALLGGSAALSKERAEQGEFRDKARAMPATERDDRPRRNAAGKVLLADLGATTLFPAVTARPRIRLAPLEENAFEPAPAQVEGPGGLDREVTRAQPVSSEVVRLSFPSPAIAVVALEDGENRNMFSAGFIRGLQDAFAKVRRSAEAKVVVVHGFASWFCSGGTPDTLDEIRHGQTMFTDTDVFRLLLDCELPTIAAMQGHALGGGLTFGLYADLPLMAEHAFYAGNFMSHGFTPGVGATFLFPEKLGKVLGTEMLFTARRYRGSELRDRGVEVQVLNGTEVIPHALELARELAEKPLPQLKLLKRRLSQGVRQGVAQAIDEELMMHRIVFKADGWAPG